MNFNLLILKTIANGIDSILEWMQGFEDMLFGIIISFAELFLTPLELFVVWMHNAMLNFLQYAPYPGMDDSSNTVYIFSSPPSDSIFGAINEFVTGYIEPLALFFVFFAIIVLLFLRVFDVVLEDIGLDISEAKKRLFLAPLLIILWLPLANLVLYFAFGMTEFINNSVEFTSIDELDTSSDERVLESASQKEGGINISNYFGALLPDTGDLAPQLAFISIFLAYIAALPAALVYLFALIGAVLRIMGLIFFYALGPIGLVLWAFNWRDLGQIGGKIMRYFVLFSLFPIVVAFINLMLPLMFVLMAEVLDGMMAEMQNDITSVATEGEEGITSDELNMISSDKMLSIIFIIITPIMVGLIPWGIVIGFEKAMKVGAAAGLAAGGGALLAGAGATFGAAKGVSGVADAYGKASGSVGELSGTAAGVHIAKSMGRTGVSGAKDKVSNAASRVRENAGAANYAMKKKYGETTMNDVEKFAAGGVMKDNFGEFGDVIHAGASGHLTAKKKMGLLQNIKQDKELQDARGYPSTLSSGVPMKDGVLDEENATEQDRLIWEDRQAEIRAASNEMSNSDRSGRQKQALGDYLAKEKGYKQLGGLSEDEADDLISDELLAEQYYEVMGDKDEDLSNVWTPSQIEDLDSSAKNVDRKDVENEFRDSKPKYYQNNRDEIQEYYNDTYGDSDITNMQADRQGHLYADEDVYQEGLDESFDDEIINQLDFNESIDGGLSKEKRQELVTEWIQNGGTQEAIVDIFSGDFAEDMKFKSDDVDESMDSIQTALNEGVRETGKKLRDEDYDVKIDTDYILSEYDSARKGGDIKLEDIDSSKRKLTSDNLEENVGEIVDAAFSGDMDMNEISAKIEGTVYEDTVNDAIKSRLNNMSQEVEFSVEDPTADLDTKINAGDAIDEKAMRQEMAREIRNNTELNDRDIDNEVMELMINDSIEAAREIADESMQGLQEDYVDEVEDTIRNLDSKEYDSMEEDMSTDFREFLSSVQQSQNSMFEELDNINDTNDRMSKIKEMKELKNNHDAKLF